MSFEAKQDVTIQGLALRGDLRVPAAKAWLSNGFQSWSQSGVVSLQSEPTSKNLQKSLNATGEEEVYRRGKEHSWWYTFVGGGAVSFFAGATTAERLRSWIQVYKQDNTGLLHVNMVNGGVERVSLVAGQTLVGESWQIQMGENLHAFMEDYGHSLQTRRDHEAVNTPVGWNSWYDLWDDVKESEILENADLILDVLGPRIPEHANPMRVVVDDGWQIAWGDWVPNDKFPSKIHGLADTLKSKGLEMGIWLAPLLTAKNSSVAKQHPEWLVKGATYGHPAQGDMYILDVTHPEAADHLRRTIETIVGWGVGFLKIDFLFGGTLEGTRAEPVTGMTAYNLALELIREAAGEETTIIAVGAPPLATFKYVDGWRAGGDIAFKPFLFGIPRPSWSFIANQARSIAAHYPYCLATLCDADPPLLRTLSYNEVDAGAWIAVSTGGALFLSDDLTRLPVDRQTWSLDEYKINIGLSGIPAVPENFFPDRLPASLNNMKDRFFTATHEVPSVWRMSDGKRIGFNFTDRSKDIEGVELPKHSARELP